MTHTSKTRGPLSIATSFGYLLPAVLLFPHSKPAVTAFAVLTLGTLLFHATDMDYGLDGAGMLAATCVLFALPYAWGWEVAAVVGGFILGKVHYNHDVVGMLLIPVSLVAIINEQGWQLALAMSLFLIGFLIWRRPGDWPHAAWHVATAGAMTVLGLALV